MEMMNYRRSFINMTLALVFFLALLLASSAARNTPNPAAAGLEDQKNFLSYGGVGGFSGIGSNGLPFGGVGGAAGAGGGGLGSGVGFGLPGGFGGGVGGGAGAGVGGGSGVLPWP